MNILNPSSEQTHRDPSMLHHHKLIEKAEQFLDTIGIEYGDPELSETLYFQTKKSIVCGLTGLEIIPYSQKNVFSATNSALQPPNISVSSKSSVLQIAKSHLFQTRTRKSMPIIKPLEFSSPQLTRNKSKLKKKPSIENFSESNYTLMDLDLSASEEEKTEPSSTFDASRNKSLKKLSVFSNLFQKETLEDLAAWELKEDSIKNESESEDDGYEEK